MLPRRLLMQHPFLVMEGLSLRGLSSVEKEALFRIQELGQEVLQAQKDKEVLQQERHLIAQAFTQGDQAVLQQRGLEIKTRLEALITRHQILERQIHAAELLVPNLPDPETPISYQCWERRWWLDQDLTYEEFVTWKRTVLRMLHFYLHEYN